MLVAHSKCIVEQILYLVYSEAMKTILKFYLYECQKCFRKSFFFLQGQNVSLQRGRITAIHEAEYDSCI